MSACEILRDSADTQIDLNPRQQIWDQSKTHIGHILYPSSKSFPFRNVGKYQNQVESCNLSPFQFRIQGMSDFQTRKPILPSN